MSRKIDWGTDHTVELNEEIARERQLLAMLAKDNKALRKAGLDLVEAATRVVNHYDGVHRLSIAVADFMKVIADEGNRDRLHL